MSSKAPKPIPKSDVVKELRRIAKHHRGVYSVSLDRLRALTAMAVIADASRSVGVGYRRRQAIRATLARALEVTELPDGERKGLAIVLCLSDDPGSSTKEDRLRAAAFQADVSPEGYETDRRLNGVVTLGALTTGCMALEEALKRLSRNAGRDVAAQPAFDTRSLVIGCLEIDGVVSLASSDLGVDCHQEMRLEFGADAVEERAPAREWPLLKSHLLPRLIDEARKRRAHFTDDAALDLRGAEFVGRAATGARRYRLDVSETTYHMWAATAGSLDRDLENCGQLAAELGAPTLRDRWRSHLTVLEDIADLPAPVLAGACVVVTAGDEMLVLRRQRTHYVAGDPREPDARPPVHFVAEGMTPEDRGPDRRYALDETARRACFEELGLAADEVELIPTAVLLDTTRWQLVACYLGRCRFDVNTVRRKMQYALDNQETGGGEIAMTLPLSLDYPDTHALMVGQHARFELASSHAQAALLSALSIGRGGTPLRRT